MDNTEPAINRLLDAYANFLTAYGNLLIAVVERGEEPDPDLLDALASLRDVGEGANAFLAEQTR